MSRTISPFSYRLAAGAIATLFAIGLTNDLSEPWIGLHDWNGAFYSQLARNLIRYPASVHHGLGVVAMGSAVPPPEERSIYATHPPGIVWLVAVAFRFAVESEAIARCVPILFSLGTILLLMDVVKRRYGPVLALLTGLIYALFPMCVYFGRMVDQESPCLFFMLAAVACWDRTGAADRRAWAIAGWGLSMAAMIFIDWAGVLFAGLFGASLILTDRRKQARMALATGWIFICVAVMLNYLVYAGFEGRWSDLWDVFTSRRGEAPENAATIWWQTFENLRPGLIVMGLVGIVQCTRRMRRPSLTTIFSDPLNIVCATGIIWVGLFLRQYRIHQYWLYYLGPHIAMAAAYGVFTLFELSRRWGSILGIAAMVWIAVTGVQGSSAYFRKITCRPSDIEMWRQTNATTAPNDRVRLRFNPILEERHGGYVFRNIVSAQLAYYLDRAVVVRPVEQEP